MIGARACTRKLQGLDIFSQMINQRYIPGVTLTNRYLLLEAIFDARYHPICKSTISCNAVPDEVAVNDVSWINILKAWRSSFKSKRASRWISVNEVGRARQSLQSPYV